jgi:hypothetical protein
MQANGIATTIQKGSLPESPDTCVGLRETGGFQSPYVMSSKPAVIEEPTVQILARAMAYDTAETLIRQVKTLFDGLRNQTINSVQYHWVTALQPPFLLERDENKRWILAFNVHIKRQTV